MGVAGEVWSQFEGQRNFKCNTVPSIKRGGGGGGNSFPGPCVLLFCFACFACVRAGCSQIMTPFHHLPLRTQQRENRSKSSQHFFFWWKNIKMNFYLERLPRDVITRSEGIHHWVAQAFWRKLNTFFFSFFFLTLYPPPKKWLFYYQPPCSRRCVFASVSSTTELKILSLPAAGFIFDTNTTDSRQCAYFGFLIFFFFPVSWVCHMACRTDQTPPNVFFVSNRMLDEVAVDLYIKAVSAFSIISLH